jgi:alpha-L-rhamnosidase
VNNASKDASLNHVFLGDVSDWMTKNIAGISFDNEKRGYSHVIIKPHFIKDLDWAKAEYKSVKGLIKSEWKRNRDSVELTVTIPANTTATVWANEPVLVKSGVHKFSINY